MDKAPPRPRSSLSLDLGRRRIGLAGCDPLGITVTPLPALQRGRFSQDLAHLRELCRQRHVELLVVGLPLDRFGAPTEQAQHCRRYGLRLAQALPMPLTWVNEHSSSWAAGEQHRLHGDRTGRLDSAVAALLLDQWLREGPEPEPVATSTSEPGESYGDAGSWKTNTSES